MWVEGDERTFQTRQQDGVVVLDHGKLVFES